MTNIITYKIESDINGQLKAATKIACNFWNTYVEPSQNIVLRVQTKRFMRGVASSFRPYTGDGVKYGRIRFKRKKIRNFTPLQIAGTMVHEIGHTLGFGWEEWDGLYDPQTGKFKAHAISQLPALADMEVETDFGRGTKHSHWDEAKFDAELMSGFKDSAEYVLPVTIDVMALMGHKVIQTLPQRTLLDELLRAASERPFAHRALAEQIDRDYFEETEIFETIPHDN